VTVELWLIIQLVRHKLNKLTGVDVCFVTNCIYIMIKTKGTTMFFQLTLTNADRFTKIRFNCKFAV